MNYVIGILLIVIMAACLWSIISFTLNQND